MKTVKFLLILAAALLLLASCDDSSTNPTICATPEISPASAIYDVDQTVTITCDTDGATIYFTTNNSDPDTTSTVYTTPFVVSVTTTVKAMAVKAGLANSPIASSAITINPTICATPEISPASAIYDVDQTVTITCDTDGATIYFTTNNSDPDTTSTVYTTPFVVSVTTTVKAMAVKAGLANSPIASSAITIDYDDCAKPTINIASGTYYEEQLISLTTTTTGATIKYTLDGTIPTINSTTYINAFTLNHNAQLRAIAMKAGMDPSQVAEGNYIIYHNMINVPTGTFTMGSPTGVGDADEHPQHAVTLNRFYIGKYEVTQQEWMDIMGSNPSNFTGNPSRPVEKVSFYDVLVYCNKRSIMEGLDPVYIINNQTDPAAWGPIPTTNSPTWNMAAMSPTANGYRLPTEAEWEYAARGATNTPDYTYSGSNTIGDVAWYSVNSGNATHAVGSKAANALGLFDMTGNVREWTWDWYSATYYAISPASNPTGPATGTLHSIRGGSYDNQAPACRVAFRTWGDPRKSEPKVKIEQLGFRVVRK